MSLKWRTEWPQWALVGGMFLLAAARWGQVPDTVPASWNWGTPVGESGGKLEVLLLIPVASLVVYLVLALLPGIDPGRSNYAQFRRPYLAVRTTVIAMLAAEYVALHQWASGRPFDMSTFSAVEAAIFLIVFGVALGKIRPNWFFGIPTPWTLSSKTAWTKTHRAGGPVLVIIGLGVLLAGVIAPEWAHVVMRGSIAAGIFAALVYSYRAWRNAPDKLAPAGTAPAD